MPLRDDLLNPIAGDNPAGADLRYDPVYEKIKEARREDDDAPQGEWQHARKVADWPLVIKLAGDALATRSKDLQLAAWLGEAMLRREGFGAFHATLDVTRGLLDKFWEHLYPEIEDGDLEMRAAPLDWIGLKLDIPVKLAPLNRAGHSYLQYAEARSIGTEQEADGDTARRAKREEAIAARKPTIEEFDKAFADTPKAFVKQLATDVAATIASLQALDALARDKFGDLAPSFIKLREVLEEEQRVVGQLLAKKLEQDPDPVEAAPAVVDAAGAALGGAADGPRVLSAEPVDRNDAASRVISAARFLRRTEALSPASYLMLRALRWGELRAAGSNPDPKLLEAPTTQIRTQLRGLMLDSAWDQLLEAAETVMGTSVGRGWLDLQRYTLTACQALGEDYAIVASAIRGELRALLGAIPTLPSMALMDDMPTATGTTLQWLRDEKIIGGEDDGADDAIAVTSPALVSTEARDREGRAGVERAAAEVRAGRPEKAIELLMRALDREKTRRGRFLRQAELARVMVDAGFVQVAQPILQELMADIEAHKLDEWEAGELVARPMVLMYRCLEKLDGDSSTRQDLYTRIARLDPLQAIGFGQG
ncbi:MAG TPA: type VI secretion system protein TssA [Gemmatimonadaceae bacterium]|jgi:type VI secretion system protein ImpA|nr:type VI secretion system protein TssA [Gemmatimonadaceae bacterium]